MPDANGKLVAGDPGYVAPAATATGLINASTPDTGTATGYTAVQATPTTATPTSYTAAPFTVAPDATVEDRVAKITASGSPLLQQAEARAAEKMNARGLLNSTQAISAGQSAVYDAALPIATQDAATFDRAATNTAGAINTASQTNAAAANNASLTNAQLGTQTSVSNAGAQNQAAAATAAATNVGSLQTQELKSRADLAAAQNSTTLSVADKQAAQSKYNADLAATTQLQTQAIDNAFKTTFQTADTAAKVVLQTAHDQVLQSIASVEADYKTLMQTSASAADIYRTTMSMIPSVIADTSISATDKATIITGYLGWMKNGINLVGSVDGVDLTGLTNFGTVGA